MLKRKKRIIAKVMATTMLATTLASTFAVEANAQEPRASVTSSKISGDDRYKTAVEISKNYSSTSKHAVVVNGQKGIVDALTATPYASLKKAPILMTQNNKLNEDTKKELTRRGIKTVDIIGGTASVSDSVKAEIEKMGITVNRIAGNSKYETSLKVAQAFDKISDISKIAVANGEVLADAVSVAAPAAQNKMPIILAHPSKGLDDATKTYIKGEGISTSYVIGGTSSVSNATQNSLPGTKKRLEGTGRQETNAKVVKEFYDTTSHDNIYVTKSGQVNKADEIADALAVGVLAAHNQDPVLIVGKNLAGEQKTLLEGKDFNKITEVGNGIPTASIQAIKDTQSSIKNVTTVAELNSALSNAKDGDVINFKPSSSLSSAIDIDTTKSVTVNIDTAHSGTVSVDMPNGVLNINSSVSNKVSVDDVKSINIASGVTVKHLEIKSTAKDCTITNKGTVTTFDVLASGVTVNNSGTITTLNPYGDTTINNTGTIGNMDSSNVVGSITAINSKQMTIRFNKAIDKNSIIEQNTSTGDTLANEKISFHAAKVEGGTKEKPKTNAVVADNCYAELSDNGMTLNITAPDDQYFSGNYTVVIENITSNGVKQDKHTGTINVKDEIAPTVNDVVFNSSNNKFEVTLSEPINSSERSKLVLKMNDNINISSVAWNTLGNKFTFARPTGVNLGSSAKIYIDGLSDIVGNKMKPYTKSSISVSKVDLSVTSTQPLNDTVRVTFNKYFDTDLVTTIDTSKITLEDKNTSPQTPITINSITPVDKVGENAKVYDIKLNNVVYNSKNESYIKLKVGKITDITGAENKELEHSITLKKDVAVPTIKSVKVNASNTGLEITMSEDINQTLTAGKIKLFKGSGVSVSAPTIQRKANTTNVVEVLAGKTLADGTYQVKFEEGAIQDLNGNVNKLMETTKVTIKNEDTTEYKVESVTSSESSNVFVVKYTGDIDDEKVSYENFKLNNQTISKTSTIAVDNTAKTITVSLPSADSVISSGKSIFTVTRLTLKSGKVLADYSDSFVVKDNTAPTLSSAELRTKSNKLVLTFDENIANIVNKGALSPENLTDILKAIEIKVGDKYTYTGKATADAQLLSDKASIEVNGKEVIITIKPVSDAEGTESEWTKNVEKSTSTIKINLKSTQTLIKDGDANSARVLTTAKTATKNSKL